MPETSGTEKPSPESPASGSDEFSTGDSIPVPESESSDGSNMRKTKPGLKRLALTLSVLISFVLGAPFLVKSVEIYRSPLPFKDMDSLSTSIESEPLLFPCHFQALFVGFDDFKNAHNLESSIADHMRKIAGDNQVCGSCASNFTVSVFTELEDDCVWNQNGASSCSWKCGLLKDTDSNAKWNDDNFVDEFLDSILMDSQKCSESNGKVYSIVIVNRDEEVRVVVGKHRHGWITGRVSEADAVGWVAEIFVNAFINGGKEEGTIRGEFMPVGADGRVVLSFSLLNADPRDWIYDWDFQGIHDSVLASVIDALAPVANISIESQILYHTPKSFLSEWDDKRHSYIFNTRDLPFFVNSNEWHLDTSIVAGGRSKILHTVIYIPSAKECPLLLQLPSGEISTTNSFISPMWGGIIVWNPSDCSESPAKTHHSRHTIPSQDVKNIVEIFMGQLRQLFGLKSESFYVGPSGTINHLASESGFTKWELDALSRKHACFNLQSCGNTLGSLSKLVQSLPRMIIKDEIGKQVEYSLQAARLARSNASLGVYDDSAVSSRQARSLAEDAFFHPSIMSVSYYSFEHCFAVYSPFFLPVGLHVLLAVFKEWRRYRQESSKYFAWKAKQITTS